MGTLLLMAPKHSQVHQNGLEGVCELQCQGQSFCAFEKTWEIRNKSTTISFSHLNPFQSFLKGFVLSLNRQRKKERISLFLCPVHRVSVTVILSPSPGVGTATFWDAKKRENQVCHFSCTYPTAARHQKNPLWRERKCGGSAWDDMRGINKRQTTPKCSWTALLNSWCSHLITKQLGWKNLIFLGSLSNIFFSLVKSMTLRVYN